MVTQTQQRLGLILLLTFLLAAGTAHAQELVGVARGVVTVDGEPIEGAVVVLKSLETDQECETKSDVEGRYSCRLTAGPYELSVKIKETVAHTRKVEVQGGMRGDPETPTFSNQFDVPLMRAKETEEERKRRERIKNIKEEFTQAVELNEAGRYEEAAPILEGLIEKDPTQWAFLAQLGQAYSHLGRLEEATAQYEAALELNPTDAGLHTNLGGVYAKLGRVEEARKEFEKAAELDPRNAGAAFFNLGLIYYKNDNLKAAVEPFRKATEIDPQRAVAFFLLGMCLYNNAKVTMEGGEMKTTLLPGTRESFERYLALQPDGRFANDARSMLQAIQATASPSGSARN